MENILIYGAHRVVVDVICGWGPSRYPFLMLVARLATLKFLCTNVLKKMKKTIYVQ